MDKIEQIYDNYADIVQIVGKEKITKRFADFNQMYEEFINEMEIKDKVKVNPTSLIHALMDYFTDITRLEDFHKIKDPNKYKYRAYEISWLLRRKPLQILDDAEELVYINEKFLLSHTLSFLIDDFENENLVLSEDKQKYFDGFIESYYYYLKYRDCSPQNLEMVFLSFDAGKLFDKK